jgi:hypothetical protein
LNILAHDLGEAMSPEHAPLAGDEFLPGATYSRTHHTIIEASPERVWPWLAQMGGDRAGWYSFDSLDNRGIPSADAIHPEWQRIAEGDLISAMRNTDAYFGVLRVEPRKVLVLGSPRMRVSGPTPPIEEAPFNMTWAFVLEPIGDDATLLCVRVRAESDSPPAMFIRYGWSMLAHEIMQREQIENLKRRAESYAGATDTGDASDAANSAPR